MGAWRTISVALQANTAGYSTSMAKAGKDTDKFGKDVDQANRKIDELDERLGRAREGLGLGIAAGTVATLGLATKAASDLREAQAAANVVFGEGADVIDAYAAGAAQAIGLSKKEALDATSVFGNLFTQLGVGQQEAARLSTSLVTLGADFGSFFNEDATRVIEAQTAAFRGEYDALQRYVPTINAAAVEQQALVETGKANADQLTQQEKALATYTLMVEGAGAAQGDFARSNGSAATEAKKASAELKNSSAEIGQSLLPVAAAGAKGLGTLARGFSLLPGPAQTAVIGVGGLTTATVLLGPKLVEGAQLLKLGATRALEFGRAMTTAGAATTLSAGITTAGVAVIAAAIGTVALVAHDEAEMAQRAREEVESLVDAVVEGGKSIQAVSDDYLIDAWIELGPQLEQRGVDFEEFRTHVLGSKQAFDEWVAGFGDDRFLGLDLMLGTTRQQLDRFNTELVKRRELEAQNARLAQEANDQLAERKRREEEATRALREHSGGLTGLAGIVDGLQPKMGSVFDGFIEDTRVANQLVGDMAGYLQSTAQVVDAVQQVADAGTRVADAEAAVSDAERSVADANRSVADARRGVADAEQAVADARGRVADAERAVVDAQRDAADAAELVTTRTRELADARRAAAGDSDEMRDALEGVVDAEEAVARAQEDSIAAQQALDDARANYGRTLAGLQRDAEGAADAVIAAEIRIREAQENAATLGQREQERVAEAQARLNKVLSDGTSTAEEVAAAQKDLADAIAALPDADDRARAELAVRDALRDYAEAQERATDAAEEAARVEAAGVEGSDEVVAARDGVAAAADREADAQGRLEDAVSNVADVQEAANQRVEDAQRNLEDAILARADADQRVLDAKDGVVEANREVERSLQGVRDANQQVADRRRDVLDREKELIARKGDVVTAEGEKEQAVGLVRTRLEEQATWWLILQTHWEVGGALRRNVRGISKEIGELAGLAGTYQVNVNVNATMGGNAADAILSGVLGGLQGAGAVAWGSPYATPSIWGGGNSVPPGGKGAAGKGLGSTPTGYTAPVAPQMAPGWAQPSSNTGIDYQALAAAVAASLPYQGPLVNVEQVNEGVGLDAVFRQAEFASR